MSPAGCSGPTSEDIEGFQYVELSPVARLAWRILPKHEKTLIDSISPHSSEERGESRPPPAWGSVAVVAEVRYVSGEESIPLGSSQYFAMDGIRINGPDLVEAEYEILSSIVGVRTGRWWWEGRLGLEFLGGASLSSTSVEAESSDQRIRDTAFTAGPLVGGRLTIQPLPWLSIYGQGTFALMFTERSGLDAVGEFAVMATPVAGVGLFAGWRHWKYVVAQDERDEANIVLDLFGPIVGLELLF